MSNIFSEIKNKYQLDDIKYFSFDNKHILFNDLKIIIDNFELICYYFQKHNIDVKDINSYVDYFMLLKILDFNSIKNDFIDENKKQSLEKLHNVAEEVLKKSNKGNVIKFINSNYEEIILGEYKKYFLGEATFDFIIKNQNGINKDVYQFFAGKNIYLYIDNFDKVYKKIKEYNLYYLVFSDINLEILIKNRFSSLLKIIKKLYDTKKESSIYQAKKIVDYICDNFETKIINIESVLMFGEEKNIEKFCRLLLLIKDERYSKFVRYKQLIENSTKEYIIKNGKGFSYKIEGELIKKFLTDIKLYPYKLFRITYDMVNDEYKSLMDFYVTKKK